ncbi:MAG: 1-deoxy-D-xylulose-5-phosphate synthase [Deltaproteobacteria bacterium RBG_16_54_18]|nr:MAG: 1-deoxy-D-xylulose-5-phosphate synthase [Deltaproteobacteria bacterium RBG_16_54_18]
MTERQVTKRRILDRIDAPEDVRRLERQDLPRLAQEIREEILAVCSEAGGHLAPSLGVVELTLALHYCFDTPRDKFIWDVGHQAYAHKLVTGRRKQFKTLRQEGGLSGFPRREESIYDPFGSGHSGTSVSAALGMAEARDLRGDDYKVVAIIGDGGLTAGMAFEALNCAGELQRDLIVVVNDNEMSISKSVGAVSAYLNRIMTGHRVNRFREDIKKFLEEIPGIGKSVVKIATQAEESLKGLVVPGILFEELGFQYFGPLDGHHIDHLIDTFRNVKKLKGPILVHVLTKKGKGYPPAEANPDIFHGVGRFERSTGRIHENSSPPTYTQVFGKTLVELAQADKRVVAITAAMPLGTGLVEFAARFPDRFYDIGIAEQHAVTFAAGLALEGLRPVVAIYSTFLQRAYDQVVHDVCLQRSPVIFALDRGGIVGEDGPTHQGLFDLSYLRHIPRLVLMAPKDENELRRILATAIQYEDGPLAFRYPRGKGEGVPLDKEITLLEIGKGEVLREGADALLLALGSTVYPSLEAAALLEQDGIQVTVVNSRFVVPLDEELIGTLTRHHRVVVTVEENVVAGGFGSAVLEFLHTRGGRLPRVSCLGVPARFMEHGPQGVLRKRYRLDPEGIAQQVRTALQQGTSHRGTSHHGKATAR